MMTAMRLATVIILRNYNIVVILRNYAGDTFRAGSSAFSWRGFRFPRIAIFAKTGIAFFAKILPENAGAREYAKLY